MEFAEMEDGQSWRAADCYRCALVGNIFYGAVGP